MAQRSTEISLVTEDGHLVGGSWQQPDTFSQLGSVVPTREIHLIQKQTQADLLEELALDAKATAAFRHGQHIYAEAAPALTRTLELLDDIRQKPRSDWLKSHVDGATNDLARLSRRHTNGMIEGCLYELASVARRSVTPPPEPTPPPPPPPKPKSLIDRIFGG